jgi:glutathione S-transferase
LTESSAIAKYIIKRSGNNELLGKTVEEEGVVNNIIGVLNDTFKEIRGILYLDNWSELKAATFEKVKSKLELLNNFIADKPFALGYLTLADFYIAEYSHYFEALYEDQRKNYPFWWNIR